MAWCLIEIDIFMVWCLVKRRDKFTFTVFFKLSSADDFLVGSYYSHVKL
jgi:hypothetical protein